MVLMFSVLPTKPTLMACTGKVLQNSAGLLCHGLVVQAEVIEDLRCVSRVGACHHSDGVAAHGGNGGDVARQPASAAGSLALKTRMQAGWIHPMDHCPVHRYRGGVCMVMIQFLRQWWHRSSSPQR